VTRRLYYDDAYALEFRSRIVDHVELDDGARGVVLDATAFYPTSGGQMNDRGELGGVSVVDVIDQGSRIVHVVEGEAPAVGTEVEGRIDGVRRAHHRQQHTGQHVLSRVIEDGYGWPTLSSRLGETMNTLEIEAKKMSPDMIREIEDRTNRVVWSGRDVRVRYLEEGEAELQGLRKKVDRAGPVRVIEVEDVDRCACGGTHVANTSQIGLVSIVGSEKIRGGTRLLFLCGERAVYWRRERVEWLDRTARHLTTSMDLVHETVTRIQDETRERRKRMEKMARELVRVNAPRWRDSGEAVGALNVVLRILDSDEALAAAEAIHEVVAEGPTVAAFVVAEGRKRQVLLAANDELGLDCGALLRTVLENLGGRGGGQPGFARGGCAGTAPDAILDAIRAELGSDSDQ
jgi:alanyl-tRNA synthetase